MYEIRADKNYLSVGRFIVAGKHTNVRPLRLFVTPISYETHSHTTGKGN